MTSDPAAAVRVEGLSKSFGSRRRRVVGVDKLDLVVPVGSIFALLGPNGAGKTTTIRSLLGLSQPDAGRCEVLGATTFASVANRVGVVFEGPAFTGPISGRRHLEILCMYGGLARASARAALEQVGLSDRADDLVLAYSQGMRQRLALAAALLKDPELLILDEPFNGLDPAALVELRDLLRWLSKDGRTVLLSTHDLNEVEELCSHVAIVNEGKNVASGPIEEVLAASNIGGLVVRCDDLILAESTLNAAGVSVKRKEDALLVLSEIDSSEVTRILSDQGVYLRGLEERRGTLESVYLTLTGRAPT